MYIEIIIFGETEQPSSVTLEMFGEMGEHSSGTLEVELKGEAVFSDVKNCQRISLGTIRKIEFNGDSGAKITLFNGSEIHMKTDGRVILL